MWFDYAREEGFPTQFPAHKNPVTVDVVEAGLIFCFVLLFLCFSIVLLGKRGFQFVSLGVRVVVSLLIGLSILLGNYGQEWEVGHVKTATPYKVGTGQEIQATIGIKIGFRSVNITLQSDSPKNTTLENEVINYNERFDWQWDQGRFGFGPYAGRIQRQFRAAQHRGLPLPILWVVDYFVADGEGLRFGRFYRTAGWYGHIATWVALPCWLLANVFLRSVVRYGALFAAAAGALQLLACLVWAAVRNPKPLRIPFADGTITTVFGSSFYLTLFGGILCVIISALLLVFDIYFPDETAEFFDIDPLSDYDEYHLSPEEVNVVRQKGRIYGNIPLEARGEEAGPAPADDRDIVLLKRRTTTRFNKKAAFRTGANEDMPVYGNFQNDEGLETLQRPILPIPNRPPPVPPKRRN